MKLRNTTNKSLDRNRPGWFPLESTFWWLCGMGLHVTFWGVSISAQDQTELRVDYSQQVRPILAKHCFACHGPDANHRESGLALHTAELAYARADSGEFGIVPGQPEASGVLIRIESDDDDERMPPSDHGAPLAAGEIDIIRRWIVQGASYEQHWAYRPMQRPEIPAVNQRGWPRNEIDYFVLAKLEQNGLAPAGRASPERLVRRLHLDLIGLPPDPEVVRRFAEEPSETAYEELVDRLLDNPAYGEHWARMWLDLARYADSQGYAEDHYREIWLYRDWVIEAFNQDKPFDEFSREQLAGDLLPDPTEAQLIATAFHRNTMTNSEGGTDDEEFRHAAIVDRVNTTATVWLGTTMACAQCHSHKYDPISIEDYYGLFAIFDQTEDADHYDERPVLQRYTPEQLQDRARLDAEISALRAQREQTASEQDQGVLDQRIKDLQAALQAIRPLTVPIMRELDDNHRRETRLAIGGAFSNKGELVAARLWSEFSRELGERPTRLDLANWLFAEARPLTARVAANRHWEKIFGRGLVETSEDFGSQGSLPSHPELLDWLAAKLEADGWSLKKFVKMLVMSETYRQDSRTTAEKLARDPQNVWLSRGARYRLTAEQIRDTALAASGLLSPKMFGPPVKPPQPKSGLTAAFGGSLDWETSPGEDRYRRGIYTMIRRTNLYPSFQAFDATNRTVCTVRRMNSNTPVAAFVTLNDPVYVECARALGRSARDHRVESVHDGLVFAFRRVLARDPSAEEVGELQSLWERQVMHFRERVQDAAALVGVEGEADLPYAEVVELAAWTVIGNVLLNLDEALTRN